MPTIYKTKLDGTQGVRYFHIPLVSFYLRQALDFAIEAKAEHIEGTLFAPSIIAIMFSAMALEAFANEMSEDVIPDEEIDDFIRLRKKYKKNKDECSVTAKFRILFEKKYNHTIETKLSLAIDEIFSLRNNLVHYKLSELAEKHIIPPVKHTKCGDGSIMTSIDFMVKPEKIEPPFVVNINGKSAVNSYNSALAAIKKWGELLGNDNFVQGYNEIA